MYKDDSESESDGDDNWKENCEGKSKRSFQTSKIIKEGNICD